MTNEVDLKDTVIMIEQLEKMKEKFLELKELNTVTLSTYNRREQCVSEDTILSLGEAISANIDLMVVKKYHLEKKL